jgi:hypothetical protein
MNESSMDRTEKVLWVSMIITLFLFFTINYAFAEDQIEILGFEHSTNPNICIMEPDPLLQERYNNELLKATYDSVRTWESELTSYTGGNWSFDIWEYEYEQHFDKMTYDFPNCNIFIEYREYNTGNDGTNNKKALGYTSFDFSKSWHKWSYIMVYLKASETNPHISLCIGCAENDEMVLSLERKDLPLDTIKRIIMHEFGHALGVGHYIYDTNNANNIPSLMYPTMDPFKANSSNIELLDLEALTMIYTKDGFGGQDGFSPYYYTIVENQNNKGWFLE